MPEQGHSLEGKVAVVTGGGAGLGRAEALALARAGASVVVNDMVPGDVVDEIEALGAKVVGVRVDGEGLVVDALPDDARLVYTTPSHQFPLGMPLSLARRRALLAWAERRNAVVIEDGFAGVRQKCRWFWIMAGQSDRLRCSSTLRSRRAAFVLVSMLPGPLRCRLAW